MSGRAIWIIFSILQCGVCAEVLMRYFTLQQKPAFMQLYVQIMHKKASIIPVAVSCARDPNCVFFSTGEMKVWGTVDQTGPITGNQTRSVKPNQKIVGHWEEKPRRICEIWKKEHVTCDPAINSLPRTECVCQPMVQRYEVEKDTRLIFDETKIPNTCLLGSNINIHCYIPGDIPNIYKLKIQLSQTIEDLSRIIIKGTFSSRLKIKLTNSKLRRKRPFFINIQPHGLVQWRGVHFRKFNYYRNPKLLQGKPFIISFSLAENAIMIILNNLCYVHYSLSDKVYLTGVDQIMVLSPKDAVVSTEVCDAKKFLLHGCVYQNIESGTKMTINLPVQRRRHLSIAAKVDFAAYWKKLIWILKSTTRRQQTIKIILAPEALNLQYKQSSLIERQKLRLGNKFVFSISAYRDELQYSLNNGLKRRCKLKYQGLFNNVDKMQIRNPIVLKEMYIQ